MSSMEHQTSADSIKNKHFSDDMNLGNNLFNLVQTNINSLTIFLYQDFSECLVC